jgi:transcriptional regulator with GAF, ATPase, and Fis domain
LKDIAGGRTMKPWTKEQLMTPDDGRGERLSRAMVDLADTLVHDFDVVEFLQSLSASCVELLDLASAGVMLHDSKQNLQVVASSDERGRTLELLELQNSEGPCLDAFRFQQPVQAGTTDALARWPMFTREAQSLGYQTFIAVPMRLRAQTIGALNLFRDQDRLLQEQELRDAQALADIATIGLLNERAVREARLVAEQLQHALTSRVVLEQAKGALAVKLGRDVDEAFQVMRTHARNHNLRLGEVARGIIDGEITAESLASP